MAKNGSSRRVVVDVDAITFGVEIECALPGAYVAEHGIKVGSYHHGISLPSPFPGGWNAQHDGSLEFGAGLVALEIVSPILTGMAGLRQVAHVFTVLNAAGAAVNTSCGFHVHVGVNSILGERAHDPALVVRWVRRLLHLVSVHELALYALSPDPNRQYSGYCGSIKSQWHNVLTTTSDLQTILDRVSGHAARYHLVNLCNLRLTQKRTVEFRAFGATLAVAQALGYIVTALGLAHRAAQDGTAPHFAPEQRPRAEAVAAVAELQATLRKYGWPTGARQQYGRDILANQQAAAQQFARGVA